MTMEIKRTITTIFMVPTLQVPKDALKNNGFINGYSRDVQNDKEYENCIYLLFLPENLDMFREFLDNEYERTVQVIDDYDYEGGLVVVVYQLNPIFDPDFKLVREGKYSKTSVEFKSLFPESLVITKNGKPTEVVSLQYQIFNKTEGLVTFWEEKFGMEFEKEQELWGGFTEENESLNLSTIKEHLNNQVC